MREVGSHDIKLAQNLSLCIKQIAKIRAAYLHTTGAYRSHKLADWKSSFTYRKRCTVVVSRRRCLRELYAAFRRWIRRFIRRLRSISSNVVVCRWAEDIKEDLTRTNGCGWKEFWCIDAKVTLVTYFRGSLGQYRVSESVFDCFVVLPLLDRNQNCFGNILYSCRIGV